MSEEVFLASEFRTGRATGERKELPGEIVAVACMDEALSFGPSVYVVGVGGSGVTRLDSGNQGVFPDDRRRLVEGFMPVLYRRLGKIAAELGMGFGVTSHVGCGWAGAQGIESGAVPEVTKQMVGAMGKEYLGHIPFAKAPVELENPGVSAFIGRSPSEHHHNAESIVLTVGGFITQPEIERETRRHGRSFILSADWLADVVTSGESIREALDFLETEVDISCRISEGLSKRSLRTFDAQRLDPIDPMKGVRNRAFVRRLMERF